MQFQSDYTTSEKTYYPYYSVPGYNYLEYINGVEDELVESDRSYQFDIAENVKGEEYYNRLYFRRRQGWGKSIITQNYQKT